MAMLSSSSPAPYGLGHLLSEVTGESHVTSSHRPFLPSRDQNGAACQIKVETYAMARYVSFEEAQQDSERVAVGYDVDRIEVVLVVGVRLDGQEQRSEGSQRRSMHAFVDEITFFVHLNFHG